MKKILVPTDFSESAENALYYAIEMAKHEKGEIFLLHVEIEGDSNVERHLKSAATKIEHAGAIKYNLISTKGFLEDLISSTINEKQIDLLIMGTNGEGNFANLIFRSNASKILEIANCPVIIVPLATNYKTVSKITYATNYNHSDILAIKKLIEIAKPFKAQLNILHVESDSESPEQQVKLMQKFMKDVNAAIQYNNVSFQLLEGKNIELAIKEYIDNDSTDLLVTSTDHRGLWDKVFGNSLTNNLAYTCPIPLMAFHHNSKLAVKFY
jgi:nucleotide-binding universal stress UspA family protein